MSNAVRLALISAVVAVVAFGAGILITYKLAPFNPKDLKLKITVPNGTGIDVEATGGEIDYARMLEALFHDDFFAAATAGWLAEKKAIYNIGDERLVSALESQLCEPIPEQPLEARLAKARECASKPVARRLRELAAQHLPPFHYLGREGRLGVPGPANQPPAGRANVCRFGSLLGKRLELIDKATGNHLEVVATNFYDCTLEYPDVQLGPADAIALFGERPLGKLEAVLIVPID